MFHLTDIQNSQKIDTMGIWKIFYIVTLKSFKGVLFIVKWYRLRLNQRDLNRTIIEHDNGFTMVNTRLFEPRMDPYVLPIQCEQVFYSEVPGKAGWSFVLRHDLRGRPVQYNLDDGNEEGSLEE